MLVQAQAGIAGGNFTINPGDIIDTSRLWSQATVDRMIARGYVVPVDDPEELGFDPEAEREKLRAEIRAELEAEAKKSTSKTSTTKSSSSK